MTVDGVSAGCLGVSNPRLEFYFCPRGAGESWKGFKQGSGRIRFGSLEGSPFELEEGEGLAEQLGGAEGKSTSPERSMGPGRCAGHEAGMPQLEQWGCSALHPGCKSGGGRLLH